MTDRPVKLISQFASQASPASGDFILIEELAGGAYKKMTPGDLIETLGQISFGAAFPGTPSSGDQFFRTDLGLLCYYDGTRWLTMNQYTGYLEHTTAVNANPVFQRHDGSYDIFIEECSVTTITLATNNGANFWTVTVKTHTPTLSGLDTIYSYATSGDTASVFTNHDGVTNQTPSVSGFFSIDIVKTLVPGAITSYIEIRFRYIIT